MVREVIHLQVGQCGNQVGTRFWETIAHEHGIVPDGTYAGDNAVQLEKIDVYYREGRDGYVPRAVLVDMENSVLNHIASTSHGSLFSPQNYISAKDGAANCFMEGFYGSDAQAVCMSTIEVIRREVERSECCQGFTFSHSASGGTGSGLAMNIFENCVDLLKPSFGGIWFFTVFPSKKISNVVTEPYNTMLTLDKLTQANDVVVLDNEALYDICFNTLNLGSPTFGDINKLIANVMSGNTASFRFNGQINTDMNKLSYSLRTRPFLHWYIPSFAPLTSVKRRNYRKIKVSGLVRQMMRKDVMLCDCSRDPADIAAVEEDNDGSKSLGGKSFSYAALFRGDISTQDVDECMTYIQPPNSREDKLRRAIGYYTRQNNYLDCLKEEDLRRQFYFNSVRQPFITITNYPPPGTPMSVTFLQNTTDVKFKFLKIVREAQKMYASGAFRHWFNPDNFPSCEPEFGLSKTIEHMSQEWIVEFGQEDGTEWPTPEEYNNLFALCDFTPVYPPPTKRAPQKSS